MKIKRGGLLTIVGAAVLIAALAVTLEVAGSMPKSPAGRVAGVTSQDPNNLQVKLCCAMEHPCASGPAQNPVSPYCCGCWCWDSRQSGVSSPQIMSCTPYDGIPCSYCPPVP